MKKFKKIYVEITNKCNLNCSFCSKSNKKKKEMNIVEFENVLKKIDTYTDYIYLHVKGEPLLHSHFRDILALSKKYHKQVNITTNGTLLRTRLDDIVSSNIVRQLNISMQSMVNKSYLNDILESVEYILNNSKIQIVLRFWALENNRFSSLQNDIIKKIITYFNFDNKVIEEIKEKNNITLCDRLYLNKEPLFVWPSLENDYYNEVGKCYGLKTHVGILSDGTVVPCCLDAEGIINLGNIFDEDFDDIMNSKRSQNMIKYFNDNKVCESLCKKCSFKDKNYNNKANKSIQERMQENWLYNANKIFYKD